MELKPIQPALEKIPVQFHSLLESAPVFDSSCSPEAQVLFIHKGDGFFLKSAPAGSLKEEAALTTFFHEKGLSAEVLAYESLESDWLLTRKIPGHDCLNAAYISDPERLCDTTAQLLRMLHSIDFSDCPVADRNALALSQAKNNYLTGNYDRHPFPDNWGYATPEDAWRVIEERSHLLRCEVLLHGDYCLPNILLDDWRFTGFIDVGNGGIGDRHLDLFWGLWSLEFNLKTDKYRDRFLDAYGREDVREEVFPLISAIEVFR